MELLQVEDLTKRFDGFTALDGVDLGVEQEELLAVIGPNGAGKTTLLNLVSGELQPTSGRILFAGERIEGTPAYRRARMGMGRTFQIASLFPALSLQECIVAALQRGRLALRGDKGMEKNAEEVLKDVGLYEKRQLKPSGISHGERRLLELGLALSQGPKLLLLDEPTAGLSRAEQEHLVELIGELDVKGIILVEHNIETVLQLAQRIVVLHRGRVLATGSPEEIRRNERVQEIYLGKANAQS